MPHAIAAIAPFLPLIEKLLPILETFLSKIFNSSDSYNKGESSLDEYLDDVNNELAELKSNAAAEGLDTSDIPSEIKTSQQATDLADELQAVLDDNNGMSPSLKADYQATIDALRKAATELS